MECHGEGGGGGLNRVFLLGSLATEKYLEPLGSVLSHRLRVPPPPGPAAFFGRGDMQRGSLLLRAVETRKELQYVEPAELGLLG